MSDVAEDTARGNLTEPQCIRWRELRGVLDEGWFLSQSEAKELAELEQLRTRDA